MKTENLYEEVLLKPFRENRELNTLLVVSGYASAAMVSRHFDNIKEICPALSIKLIVGMCLEDGINKTDHQNFLQLVERDPRRFSCSYVNRRPVVHSKVYVLCASGVPKLAFTGSANYTQKALAFPTSNREVLAPCDETIAYNYFQKIERESIFCDHIRATESITIKERRSKKSTEAAVDISVKDKTSDIEGLEKATLPLLARGNKIHTAGGLNWGQRKVLDKKGVERARNKNEAYIPVPKPVVLRGFFPLGSHFSVITDDDKTFILRTQQSDNKAITTPDNNSWIGEYFRMRLGLPSGAFVTKEDLVRYGRTDVDFYKIDDETFYMDFSRPSAT